MTTTKRFKAWAIKDARTPGEPFLGVFMFSVGSLPAWSDGMRIALFASRAAAKGAASLINRDLYDPRLVRVDVTIEELKRFR